MEEKKTSNNHLRNTKKHSGQSKEELLTKFKIIFDNVCSGIAIYETVNDGQDFVFVDFNRAAEEIEKIKKEELIGKNVVDVFPGIIQFGLLDVFRRVYSTGIPEHFPISVYKDDRITGWRENYVYKLPSGQIIAVYDDVTSQKRTELMTKMTDQCFRAIANYSYDWEVWVGPSGRILWTNPAVLRITGYKIREIMSMKDYPEPLLAEKDRDRIVKAFRSAVRGSTGNDVRFELKRKNGRLIPVSISWQSIYDSESHNLGHRESIRDITTHESE